MDLLKSIFKGDKVIWIIFLFLCLISITEVFSAASTLTYKSGDHWGPITQHSIILMVGAVIVVLMHNIPYKWFQVFPVFLLPASAILLVLVMMMERINGAARWMTFMGIQFQPSEIAKGALVLATAQTLSAMQTDKGADRKAFGFILVGSAFLIIPIFLENFSTAALITLTLILMMFVGRVPLQQLGKLLGFFAIVGVFGLSMIMLIGEDKNEEKADKQILTEQVKDSNAATGKRTGLFHRFDTWKARIDKFLNSEEVSPEDYDLDKDAQVAHANIAIASSNIMGKGPGNSNERDFLSQAFSDFIYAIIIEEMGIIGSGVVAFLYIMLLFRAGRIASRCENAFPAFLSMGFGILLVTQALFNMLVAVGLAPVTGQPLPLVSKGGTSTIINCIYIGAILSVSRSAKKKDTKKEMKAQPIPAMA